MLPAHQQYRNRQTLTSTLSGAQQLNEVHEASLGAVSAAGQDTPVEQDTPPCRWAPDGSTLPERVDDPIA